MTATRPGGKAYIFLNGDFEPPPDWPARPGQSDLVVAADGGGRRLAALGWPAKALVGDFDSLEADILAALAASGAEVFRHPAAKDEIDFELALTLARERGYEDIEVLGALGGRWDMTFGNVLLALSPDFASLRLRFRHGPWTLTAARGPAEATIKGAPGDLLSLLPLGGDVRGISLSGCRYPLSGESLPAGRSRGLSNELTGASAGLRFDSGYLLVMHRAGERLLTQLWD